MQDSLIVHYMMKLYSYQFFAMGTECVLHLYADGEERADAVAQSAIDEVTRIEARYSRYRDDSVLSAINHAAANGGTVSVDAETAGLLDYAFACHAKSDGLFDITSGVLRRAWDFSAAHTPSQSDIESLLPLIGMEKVRWVNPELSFLAPGMELDFGGIGKEYATDQAAAVCVSQGIAHGLVDLGGDICVIGPHPDGEPWRIGIRHPRNPDQFMASVDLARGAVASSGDYERYIEVGGKRYCHILNPRTGWPVQGLSSASILADQCLVAGSLSTIAMLKGEEGRQWLDALGVSYVLMDMEGNMEGTQAFHMHP